MGPPENWGLTRPLATTDFSTGIRLRAPAIVLHLYQMVKDLRTEHEVGNPAAVLDSFLESGIRWHRQHETPVIGWPLTADDAGSLPKSCVYRVLVMIASCGSSRAS